MKAKLLLCFWSFFIFNSCSDYSPKPYGYFRMDLEDQSFQIYRSSAGFSFQIPTNTKIESWNDSTKSGWFNIFYPSLNTRIYCSYSPITRSTFNQVNEANLKLIGREFQSKGIHSARETLLSTKEFSNPEKSVFAFLYDIQGNVASPVQVMITDSVKHFFWASLYFSNAPNQDSIAPVKEYVRKNMITIVESFQWESK